MIQFPQPGLEEFDRTYNIGTFDVNHDESRIAIATNLSGKFNVWGLDLPNTFPYALTHQDQLPSFVKFHPQDEFILVGFDKDGDENHQIYAISPNGGALVPVCTAEGKRVEFGALSKDGKRIYYSSDKDNQTFMNIYRHDIESGTETIVAEGTEGTIEFDALSPDESAFTYGKAFSNTHVITYLVQGEKETPLIPDVGTVQVTTSTRFVTPNTLVFLTNYQSPYSYLAKYDLTTGTYEKLFALEGRDIGRVQVNEQGLIVCVAEHGVEDELYLGSLESAKFNPIEFPGAVVFRTLLHNSGRLYAIFTQEDTPANLYRREQDGRWTKLSNIRVMGADKATLVRAETIRYPSFDGMEIESMLFRAKPEVTNGHTIILPHGGPQAADRKYFWSLSQFLVARGYSIFSPNYRGSTGYGSEFVKLVERDWGGAPREDIVVGIEYLIKNGLAAADKLFVLGGSFGGYMTLLLHGRHANYFRAAVDIFGPSNLFTFYNSVPEFWKPLMDAWVGNPERDKEKMTADSPITYLDGMTKPMLVIQGANDPRVVKAESDQIVEKLRGLGREVEYMVLEDEGHGFTKKENEQRVYRTVVEFLDRHLAR